MRRIGREAPKAVTRYRVYRTDSLFLVLLCLLQEPSFHAGRCRILRQGAEVRRLPLVVARDISRECPQLLVDHKIAPPTI